MKIRLAAPMIVDSIVDGPGLRAVVWTQGCIHNCPGCHNPATHDLNGGFEADTEDIEKEISKLRMQKGITISGGEPFLQSQQCAELAQHAHSLGMNVWCYTGFKYEELIKSKENMNLINNIDVLVDGPFILQEKSLDLKFRGSKNQRCIYLDKGNIVKIE